MCHDREVARRRTSFLDHTDRQATLDFSFRQPLQQFTDAQGFRHVNDLIVDHGVVNNLPDGELAFFISAALLGQVPVGEAYFRSLRLDCELAALRGDCAGMRRAFKIGVDDR